MVESFCDLSAVVDNDGGAGAGDGSDPYGMI